MASDLEQTTVCCKVCLKAAGTKGSGPTQYHSGTLVVHYEMHKTAAASPARKQPTLVESFNLRVPYEKKPGGQLLQMPSRCISLNILCPYSGKAGG